MNRQKIGMILFWAGVALVIVWQALTWIQSPIHRVNTAEELIGTTNEIWGVLFTIRIIGGGGMTFALVGALLYASEKGSYFWLLGFVPNILNFGQYWQPTQHVPALFGIGGTVILFSFFGVLWYWTKTHTTYKGAAKRGREVQLLGISVLMVAALFLCMYFGNPKQIALADLAIPSGEMINFTLALGFLLLFLGYYVAARGEKQAAD